MPPTTRNSLTFNWTEKPVPLELFWPDGTRETRLLAPRETQSILVK